MGGVCSVCGAFRIDSRCRCKCGATQHRIAMGLLYLRCEWCRQLFAWAPKSLCDCVHTRPRCCSWRCSGREQNWRREQDGLRRRAVNWEETNRPPLSQGLERNLGVRSSRRVASGEDRAGLVIGEFLLGVKRIGARDGI